MKERLDILKKLLAKNGSIWISIDDDEGHYLKIICDEVFGRINFVNTVVWEKKYAPQNDAKWLSDSHDFILVYAKDKKNWRPNNLPRTAEMDSRYKNPDNDPRGPWQSDNLNVRTYNASCDYSITTPSGRIVNPPKGRSWMCSFERYKELLADGRIYFGRAGTGVPRLKRYLSEVRKRMVCKTIWKREEVGDNQDAKREVKAFNDNDVFETPKPEKLIQRVIMLATNPNDIVLDSFLGSGTTAAVAHKMNRKWIGIEMGAHCYTHCKVRMDKVIEGEQGGISADVNWQGGGGYKFYELATTLLVADKYGNLVFSEKYNYEMVVEAVIKLNGYKYSPSKTEFWKQGYTQDNSYIFVLTNFLTESMLDAIEIELGTTNQLLICATSFANGLNKRYENITIKKIPQSILNKYEYGVSDYNLNIVDSPKYNKEDEGEIDD